MTAFLRSKNCVLSFFISVYVSVCEWYSSGAAKLQEHKWIKAHQETRLYSEPQQDSSALEGKVSFLTYPEAKLPRATIGLLEADTTRGQLSLGEVS